MPRVCKFVIDTQIVGLRVLAVPLDELIDLLYLDADGSSDKKAVVILLQVTCSSLMEYWLHGGSRLKAR